MACKWLTVFTRSKYNETRCKRIILCVESGQEFSAVSRTASHESLSSLLGSEHSGDKINIELGLIKLKICDTIMIITSVSNEGLDRACAYAQYHQSLRFSHTQNEGEEDDSDELLDL